MYRALCIHIFPPTELLLQGVVFSYNVHFERKVKGASALYCVYKKKVLYVFITLIIVIKSLPFLICGLGGFLFVFLFGGFLFVFFFRFVFLGKKKKTLLLVFVLLLVRTLKY